MSETDWTADILGQRVYDEAGNEILPTVNEWQLFGLEGTINTQTNRLELRASGGFDWQESVRMASAANFASTRVGNVLTATSNGALSLDGVAAVVDDRALLKDQSAPANNGLWDITDPGSASTPAVLQRSSLADETGEITPGLTVQVEEGTAHGGQYWYVTNTGSIVVNATAITFGLAFDPNASVTSSSIPSTDMQIARYDGVTGQVIEGSPGFTCDDSGDVTITGKLTVTGSIDPTDIIIEDVATTAAFLELREGTSAGLSGAGNVRIRNNGGAFEVSENGAAYAAPGGNPVDIVIADNTTDAWLVREGTNDYFDIDTNNGSEAMTYGNFVTTPTHNFICNSANISAFRVQDGAAGNLFRADTSGNRIHIASTGYTCSITVNPSAVAAFVVEDSAGVDLFNWRTDTNLLTIQQAGGDTQFLGDGEVIFDGDAIRLTEQVADPGATGSAGKIYTRNLFGTSAFLFQDDNGLVEQLTAAGTSKTPGTLQTTNATITTLATFTSQDDTAFTLMAYVSIKSATDGDGGGMIIAANFENTGGTAAQIGATATLLSTSEDATWGTVQGAPAVFVVSAGADVTVDVEGGAGDTVDWRGWIRSLDTP